MCRIPPPPQRLFGPYLGATREFRAPQVLVGFGAQTRNFLTTNIFFWSDPPGPEIAIYWFLGFGT